MDYTIISVAAIVSVSLLLMFYSKIARTNNTNEINEQFSKEMLKIKPLLNGLEDDISKCASLGFGNLVVGAILSEKKRLLFRVHHLDLDGVIDEQISDIDNALKEIRENPKFTKIKTVNDNKKIPRLIKDIKRFKKKLSAAYSRGDILVSDGSKDIEIISEFETTITCFYYIKKLKEMNDNNEFQALVISGQLETFFNDKEFELKDRFKAIYDKEAKRTKELFKSGDGD